MLNLHDLYFVKLVQTIKSFYILAIRTSLGPEARRVRDQAHRQDPRLEDPLEQMGQVDVVLAGHFDHRRLWTLDHRHVDWIWKIGGPIENGVGSESYPVRLSRFLKTQLITYVF